MGRVSAMTFLKRWPAGPHRTCRRFRRLVFFMGLGIALANPVRAADPLLRADFQPLALRPRTAAPAFVDVKLQSRQQAILEGTLELQVMSGNEVLFRQQTPELALAPGVTTRRLLLPSVVDNRGLGVNVQLYFLIHQARHNLGQFPIAGEFGNGRQYLIGVCGLGSSVPQSQARLWQALRPESVSGDPNRETRQLNSLPAWLSPEDLPSAIGLCAFDVIALEGASFSALDEKQLAALATWVEAGGSLCVAPKAPLSQEHLAFLNHLAGGPAGLAPVIGEPGGRISFRDGPMILRRPGIGRLVIARDAPVDADELISPEWRRAASFLAKAHSDSEANDRAKLIASAGSPRYVADRVSVIQQTLFARLPQSSRMIPLSVIAGILGAFVLLVGPGEWIVLGRWRLRRWTWVTFPIFAAGFAFLMVHTAENYLGRGNRQSALIVTDVGRDGQVVRENRLELRMTGSNTTVVTDLRQSLGSPCRAGMYGSEALGFTPLYQGLVPAHYTLREELQQWKPLMQRTMRFAPIVDTPDIRWPEIDARGLGAGKDARHYIVDPLTAQGWTVDVFHLGTATSTYRRADAEETPFAPLSIFRDSDSAVGMAALSPSGRADLRDLALHDPTDPGEWLVVATKSTPGALHIVRRLYHTDD